MAEEAQVGSLPWGTGGHMQMLGSGGWISKVLQGFAAWLFMVTHLACTHTLLRPGSKDLRDVGPLPLTFFKHSLSDDGEKQKQNLPAYSLMLKVRDLSRKLVTYFFPKPDNSSEGTLNCLNISQQNTFLLLGEQSFHVCFGFIILAGCSCQRRAQTSMEVEFMLVPCSQLPCDS